MVGTRELRQRKSRASYSNVAEGLADLSSSSGDEAGPSANPSRSGSRAGGDEKSKRRAKSKNASAAASGSESEGEDGQQSSFSSGESSEFQPDSPVKGNEKGKGKASGKASDDDDDDVLMNEVVDSDEDEDGDDDLDPALRSISETPDLSVSRGGRTNKRKSVGITNVDRSRLPPPPRPGVSTAAQPAHGQSEINLLDRKYRELIKASTESLTKAPSGPKMTDTERHLAKDRDQSRTFGVETFPNGHPVPFSTQLVADPQHGWIRNLPAWADESGPSTKRKETRRQHGWDVQHRVTLGSPWEEWRGEGWWPEMYVGPEEGTSGDRGEWLLRDEVRLGLNDIGRWTREELRLLDEVDAEAYLPTPIDKHGDPWITCYLGPHDNQRPIQYTLFDSKPLTETTPNLPREGHTFFAGGPIWGMDWCPYPESKSYDFGPSQYLAVSTLPHIDTRPAMSEKWPRSSKGCIQIWSLTPQVQAQGVAGQSDNAMNGEALSGGMKCEMVLCVQGGPAMEIKWMPLGVWDDYEPASIGAEGTKSPKLGILAAIQLDGSVSFYAVPHPRFIGTESFQPIYVQMDEPLLRLEVSDTVPMCFDWISASRMAVGLANGHVIVWDIYDALRSGNSDELLPVLYTQAALSAIRSIAVGRIPPAEDQLGGEPIYLIMGSYDGSTVVMDMRDPQYPVEINKARVPSMAVGWLAQMATPVLCDIDYVIQTIKMRKANAGRSHYLSSHRGQAWDIASSDYHTMLLTAGADGVLMLADYNTGFYRRRKAPLVMRKMFEMDYNETTDEYRILDDILPESMNLDTATSRRPPLLSKRATHDPASHRLKTGAWSPHVSVLKVAWNQGCGLGKAGWYAAGTAAGLGRVEWVQGRWRGEVG